VFDPVVDVTEADGTVHIIFGCDSVNVSRDR
jgi:hypothetical protein